MDELGRHDAELSILFVDDPQIQALNRRYLRRDKPTNVLAFAMREGEFSTLHPALLGDLVISVETAHRQSGRFGLNPADMVILLMVHGILHLLGYEHEGSRTEAREMATKQQEVLRSVLKQEKQNREKRKGQ